MLFVNGQSNSHQSANITFSSPDEAFLGIHLSHSINEMVPALLLGFGDKIERATTHIDVSTA